MRRASAVVAVVLLAGLPLAAVAEDHENGLMAEVRAFGDAVTEAMMANDVERMLGMYVEDAISLPNFGPRMDGVEEFRAHHEMMESAGMKVLSFESDPTDVWQAGDQVIEIGTYEIALEMPGMPGPVEDKGKYMTIYVRDADGKLKVKAETWNTDMNPMDMGMGGDAPAHGHGDAPADEVMPEADAEAEPSEEAAE